MDTAVTGVLVIGGMVLAFLFGRGYQAAYHAWAEYKTTKAKVPPLLRVFWAAVRAAVVVGMMALLYLTGSVYLTTHGPADPPAPVPAAPASTSLPR